LNVRSLIRVVTASESAAGDSAAIAAGVPSRALMQRAGAAAAAEIALRYRDRLSAGVLVLAGPGNNGGDAWVVTRALRAAGTHVRVVEPVEAKTPDARAERALALGGGPPDAAGDLAHDLDRGEALIVDGLLGTGAGGAPRGEIAIAIEAVAAMRERGATVVAIDVPSGLDATSGITPGAVVVADLTLTFASVKRGILMNRGVCGTVVVIDIGLDGDDSSADGAARLVDERWVGDQVPPIKATAHKGDRKKLAIVGGASGMAGAAVLAARAALRSGIGMVKLVVSAESLPAVQQQEPFALATSWPDDDAAVDRDLTGWADAIVVGPGLGRADESRAVLARVLGRFHGPVVLDADAITIFEGRADQLAQLLASRPALLTPHPVEFSRIASRPVQDVLDQRFEVGAQLASALGAAVLLKGTPTIISDANGRRLVSAAGTPALATGGSGDVLSGIAGTLVAQLGDPFKAGAVAAWIHGRAAERVPMSARSGTRGIALEDVINELRDSWTFDERPTRYPVLVELPTVGET
jgi:ADP-dependent NAD(P)H-hydrate dehydratase / NAD(P)H-hydrate epimerase